MHLPARPFLYEKNLRHIVSEILLQVTQPLLKPVVVI